ncbi:MAG: efflux RND transporter periplasmic adaptor subunit [Gemmataceae bacterium]|nr:efflux RND transporter periplasmic adaptor subunit [Gemmataceae bacterium]
MRMLMNLFQSLIVPLLLAGLVAALLLWPAPPTDVAGGAADYTCSMHPQVRLPKGQKCPLCGMDLVPVAQLGAIQAALEERAGVQTEGLKYRELFKEVRTVGRLDYNERQVAYITARIAGRVDRVYADFTGIQVKKDHHLVDIYSPDLVVAQDELIRALDAKGSGVLGEATLEAARTKLRLLGILPEQIQAIEKSRKRATHLTIYAPIGGTVIEKSVRVGQYVKEGDVLYRIADLDPIWLYLDIYEYDLGWVRFGQPVDVTLEAFPGETFRGTVAFIDPFLNERTRAVKVRVNLKNSERRLKPGMYASAAIEVRIRPDGTPAPTGLEGKYICPMHPEVVRDKPGDCNICDMPLERVPDIKPVQLKKDAHAGHDHAAAPGRKKTPKKAEPPPQGKVLAIRSSAVLDTGRRQVAYRLNDDGAYELVELTLGPRATGKDDSGRTGVYYPVLSGLKPGEFVVVRGGFLLDSQRQIEGMPSLLFPGGQAGANLHAGHAGHGEAKSSPSTKEPHKH